MTYKMKVRGVIISNDEEWIYEMFDIDATSPRMVDAWLEEANGEDIEVSINSIGGYVYQGSEIYTSLKSYAGKVETKIVGLAASAASVIALGGHKVSMAPTGELMIHNASTMAWGDYHDMDKASEMLKNTNEAICSAYRLKTGMSQDDLLKMMDEETWMTAEKAKELGFVDEILFVEDAPKLTAAAGSGVIPQKVIAALRSNKNQGEYVDKDTVATMFGDFRRELMNEFKQNNQEPEPKPAKNMGRLFLNLK